MKKIYYYVALFLLFLSTSCAIDKIDVEENNISSRANVWEYNGDNSIIKNVIQQLKEGSSRKSLEDKLSRNEVLWDKSRFTLIDGKKRILVPYLSADKDNVIGVISLVKNSKNKTMFELTNRTQLMVKTNQLPFWDNGIWLGYFIALDKDILNVKNGNPGFKSLKIPSKSSSSANHRLVCANYEIETTHYSYYYTLNSTGEIENFGMNQPYSTYDYSYTCYEVPDEPYQYPHEGGGGNNGGGDVSNTPLIIFADPSVIISNINDYLKCFDLSKGAVFTIYTDQPTPNSTATWSGSPRDPDVGHTFIALQQGTIRRVFGFYPKTAVNPYSPIDKQAFGNNEGYSFDVSINIPISSSQLLNIIGYTNSVPPNYDLNNYNCTDFGIQVANLAGLSLPDSYGSWLYGGGSNPGTLGQNIRNMTLPSIANRQTTTTNAANNFGNCN